MLSKTDLLGILEIHADQLRLINVFRVLTTKYDISSAFANLAERNTAFTRSFSILDDKGKLCHTVDEIYRTLLRAAISEAWELTKSYCKSTKQMELFNNQPWFNIFRFYRNAFNHDFRIIFKEKDYKLLPIEWNCLKLTLDDDGKELTYDLFPPEATLEWLEKLEDFIVRDIA